MKADRQSRSDASFSPGFRFSILDLFVLIAAACATWLVGRELWWAGMLIGYVVGHFFLFCNVFRISRNAELIWAGVFVVLAGSTIATGLPGWVATIIASLLLTNTLVALEMRKPSYHGIAWHRVNPNLRASWEANRTAQSTTAQTPRKAQGSNSNQSASTQETPFEL